MPIEEPTNPIVDDPQIDVPPSTTTVDDPQTDVPNEDVFGGEQDEAARLEIEKNLLTSSDNSPTAEDGEQPEQPKEENDT